MLFALVVMASLSPAPVMEVTLVQPDRAAAPGIAAQRDAMKKLEWLVGDWEGPAKFDAGRGGAEDTWTPVRQSEVVKMKLGGRVLLVEGTGRAKMGGEERVLFEALATVSYDPDSKTYKMRAFAPDGEVDPMIEVGDKSVVWSFAVRNGRFRYTVKLDESGRWTEIGERSSDDGKTWTKFVDMVLEKKAASTPK
jgi:hypothetical protein